MNSLDVFDLHCDTALKLCTQQLSLSENPLHISLQKAAAFRNYIQVMAIWCDNTLSDNACWLQFLSAAAYLKKELRRCSIPLITNGTALTDAVQRKTHAALLAVEDARLLEEDLLRLSLLCTLGVRFLTLTWSGISAIGGAHDTDEPLTPFGRAVTERCFQLGIIPDISHASRRTASDVLMIAGQYKKPVIATHSNAFSVHSHTRNLTDGEFSAIAESGGVVGISLAPQHLTDGPCGIDAVVRHIRHYLSLGGEDVLCLGCDFDGIEETPNGLSDISRLPALRDALLSAGIPEKTVRKIFFENAYGFAVTHI